MDVGNLEYYSFRSQFNVALTSNPRDLRWFSRCSSSKLRGGTSAGAWRWLLGRGVVRLYIVVREDIELSKESRYSSIFSVISWLKRCGLAWFLALHIFAPWNFMRAAEGDWRFGFIIGVHCACLVRQTKCLSLSKTQETWFPRNFGFKAKPAREVLHPSCFFLLLSTRDDFFLMSK